MKIQIFDSHISIPVLEQYGIGNTFVETGTYNGDTLAMILASKTKYDTLISVELDKDYYARAVQRFGSYPNTHIWLGDSPDCLTDILHRIEGPATFWLDAHASGPLPGGASGGTPVIDELIAIKDNTRNRSRQHTIFIDDRRLFGSAEWSYVTEEQAIKVIKEINPDYQIVYLDGHVPGDVLCAYIPEPQREEINSVYRLP